jgi:crotonobetainyl-CoA hydratase
LQELRGLNKPVIAAVNGIACGGGLELALSADIILAAEHATFALPEIRSGTVADAASIKLPKRIPYHIAMELLLTGRWFDVEEAARWGLVNRIVPAGELMDGGACPGRRAGRRAAAGLRRDQGDRARGGGHEVPGRAEPDHGSQFETVERLYRSEDQMEGARAFAENAIRSGRVASEFSYENSSVRVFVRKLEWKGRTGCRFRCLARSSSPVP